MTYIDASDELAGIIRAEYTRAIDRGRVSDCFDAPADAIIAAGYTKGDAYKESFKQMQLMVAFLLQQAGGKMVVNQRDVVGFPNEGWHIESSLDVESGKITLSIERDS